MRKPRVCAVIVNSGLEAIEEVEPLIDLFEVRIDLVGEGWQDLIKRLGKPWIACNRIADEGGSWRGDEQRRIGELFEAAELGAGIVDIELGTPNLKEVVRQIDKKAKRLISFHQMTLTPSLDDMSDIVRSQLEAGADICKVITTAQGFEDNLTVLQLIAQFPNTRIVSFAMGPLGLASRVLCPLVGGDFTYASIEKGRESAPGQVTVSDLRKIYEMVE